MDKETGFMQIERQEPGYRPPKERIADFKAVEKRLSESEIRCQAGRCMDCGVPFCHGYGCPLSNIAPEWNELVYRKQYKKALQLLLSTSPFPEITARVCPALCEASCVLGINSDPVTIRQIELFIIEKGFQMDWIKPAEHIERNSKCVAVVGSGPAGLGAAHALSRSGYAVTVFESAKYAGGLLRYGIPDFKLEKWVLERRIKLMEAEDIHFETETEVGKDLSPDYLKRRFDAVVLTGGARTPRDLNVPGRELDGIHFALEFLAEQNRILGKEVSEHDRTITAQGKHVVVIGGGDTGSDCIGTAIRQGAAKVTQLEILPKPPESRPCFTPWPEWPYLLRTSSSHKEGCDRMWNVQTTSFEGKEGKVASLKYEEVEWSTASDGCPVKFKLKPDSRFDLKAELVLLSMGFTGPAKDQLLKDFGVQLTDQDLVERGANSMTNVAGVFVAGDMTKGASLVVRAIADGMDVAGKVDAYLKRESRE